MDQGLGIKIDDVVIVGVVVLLGALVGLGLMRAMKWRAYPWWILLIALIVGIAFNNWLFHAVQPRF